MSSRREDLMAVAGADGSETCLDEPFAQMMDAAQRYVMSSTLEQVDRNAELVRGDLGKAVQQLPGSLATGRRCSQGYRSMST